MNVKPRSTSLVYISLGYLIVLFFQSCSSSTNSQVISVQQPTMNNTPSMVEKLWLARHQYDDQRRLIIPKVGASRWGAVQEYTADGNLVYRDWWLHNLKVEDLDAAPSTEIEVINEEDLSARPPVLGASGIDLDQGESDPSAPGIEVITEENSVDPGSPITDPFGADAASADPFAPDPSNQESVPEMTDPFAPAPNSGGLDPVIPDSDPFAPLPPL
ncbi:MAG: hypothetical protein CMI28_00720 [Opitutae bacterium]|nr:hypothetical protein [Opitutae bacterium]